MNNLVQSLEDIKKIKEREERLIDKNKCDYYLSEIKRGNYALYSQAREVANDIYVKYIKKDPIVVGENTSILPSRLEPIKQLEIDLNALKRIIAEIERKEDLKNREENDI